MVKSSLEENLQQSKSKDLILDRRRRLHELVLALIQKKEDLEFLDAETPLLEGSASSSQAQDPGRWLDRNRRILKSYQALIRSAVTLDALLDAEQEVDP